MTYETVRKYFTREGEKNPTAYGKLAAGAVSGAFAQTCTYPLYAPFSNVSRALLTQASDVLRRRFQVNTMSNVGYQYKSIWDALTSIFAQEGARGFYKGIVPNLLKVAPSMASSWLSFEMTRDFFVSLRAESDRI